MNSHVRPIADRLNPVSGGAASGAPPSRAAAAKRLSPGLLLTSVLLLAMTLSACSTPDGDHRFRPESASPTGAQTQTQSQPQSQTQTQPQPQTQARKRAPASRSSIPVVTNRGQSEADQQRNVDAVLSYYEAGLNRKDFDAAARHLGPHYIQHNPTAEDGIEGFRRFVAMLRERYPQNRSEIRRA